jgi:hypothetical protein
MVATTVPMMLTAAYVIRKYADDDLLELPKRKGGASVQEEPASWLLVKLKKKKIELEW